MSQLSPKSKYLVLSITKYLMERSIVELINIATHNDIDISHLDNLDDTSDYYIAVLYELTNAIANDMGKLYRVMNFIECHKIKIVVINL